MRIGSRWPLALAVVAACKQSPAPDDRAPAAAAVRTADETSAPPEVNPAPAPPDPSPSPSDVQAAPLPPSVDPVTETRREALEAIVRPFLAASVDNLIMEEGPFGPAPKTIVVVTFTGEGRGDFSSFALVPDGSARSGYRKLPMPWLPSGSSSGEMEFAAIGNLDRDQALELVIKTQVTRAADNKEGGYTYEALEPVALDWDARHKKFVRLAAVETKLKEAFAEDVELPSGEEIRKALGLDP